MSYNKFSDFLKNKYNSKVYKIPVNLPSTCPNRDGVISNSGCIFCGEEGAGFENLSNTLSVENQLRINIKNIEKKYKPKKFIPYFQNFSNTYFPIDVFKKYVLEACIENVVAIYISTRPDCINERYLEFLSELKENKNIDIVIELGLQTVNYHTLKILNRGHTLAEFIDSVINIKKFNLETCVHYIVDLPYDNLDDVVEGSKIISALKIEQVKCHSLYILENTILCDLYKSGMISTLSVDDYLVRIINFLEYLSPDIVIQRLIGRAPKERSVFCNWGMSWWKVHDMLIKKMEENKSFQGKKFNYLNGKSLQF